MLLFVPQKSYRHPALRDSSLRLVLFTARRRYSTAKLHIFCESRHIPPQFYTSFSKTLGRLQKNMFLCTPSKNICDFHPSPDASRSLSAQEHSLPATRARSSGDTLYASPSFRLCRHTEDLGVPEGCRHAFGEKNDKRLIACW